VLENNSGNDLSVAANGSFVFTTNVASGAAYSVTVLAQPATPVQKCVVTNGSGAVANAAIASPSIVCTTQYPRPGNAFNYYGGTMSAYAVDALTGQLRIAGTAKIGQAPISILGDKAGLFFYALNSGRALSPPSLPPLSATTSSISAFKVGSAGIDAPDLDGTEVIGSPFATSSGQPAASFFALHPSDKFIYVSNQSLNNIDAFAIDSNSGALAAVSGSPFATGTWPGGLAFDAAGQFAYVANRDSDNVYVYSVNTTSGALTEVLANRTPTGSKPVGFSFSPNKKFAYVVNQDSGTIAGSISAFSVNSSTGALTAIQPSAFPIGINPNGGITYHPNGKVLYAKNIGVAGTTNGSVSAFSIDSATGVLTPLPGSPYAVGVTAIPGALVVAIDPAGKFLYIANSGTGSGMFSNGSISAFSIDSTGALTPIAGLPSLTPSPFSINMDVSGKFLYQSNVNSDQIVSYSINATTGALTRLAQGGIIRAGSQPTFTIAPASRIVPTPVVFVPKFAYVPNAIDSTISTFASNPTSGALSVVGAAVPAVTAPQAVAVAPRKKYALVASSGASPSIVAGTLASHPINQTTGALGAAVSLAATGLSPKSVATDPISRFAYVANAMSSNISAYTLNDATGALTATGTTSMATAPIAVVVDPTGRNLYALSSTQIVTYMINNATGALGAPYFNPQTVTLPSSGATQVTVDPNGNFLYVSIPGPGAGQIVVYPINAYVGTLDNQTLPGSGASTIQTTNRPNVALAIDPTGRFAYTADSTNKTVSAYSINQTTGTLLSIGSPLTVADDANSVSVDISGKFVYVVLADKTVATYSIGATGALTLVVGGGAATGIGPGPITLVGASQ
jgi:6-phosphogluconolactonase (cycloisomerase 2 family)